MNTIRNKPEGREIQICDRLGRHYITQQISYNEKLAAFIDFYESRYIVWICRECDTARRSMTAIISKEKILRFESAVEWVQNVAESNPITYAFSASVFRNLNTPLDEWHEKAAQWANGNIKL